MEITQGQYPIKIAQNENPFGPSPMALKAIQKHYAQMSRYPEPHSSMLKSKIAVNLDRNPDNIFVSAGLVESLDILIRNFISADENLVIPEISFVAYKLLANVFKKEARFAKMRNYGIDVEQILSNCDKKTRAIIIANPNNPTGTVISEAELLRVLKNVPSSTLVVMDEAYIEYSDYKEFPDTLKLQSEYPNLIVMRTFSKIYGLAGLRVGYTIAAKELIDKFEHFQAPFTVNKLASIAAHEAMDDDEFVKMSKSTNKSCRELLFNKLRESGYKVVPSQSNFLYIHFESQTERNILFEHLEKKNILVRKTDLYGDEKAFRITIGTPEINKVVMSSIAS